MCAYVCKLVVVMFRSLYGTEMRLESQFILPVIPKLNLPFICKEKWNQKWFKNED